MKRCVNVSPWSAPYAEKSNVQKMHIAFDVSRTRMIDLLTWKDGVRV